MKKFIKSSIHSVIAISLILSPTVFAAKKSNSTFKFQFEKWQKFSGGKNKGALQTNVYQRFIQYQNMRYPVGTVTHVKIQKNGPKKALDPKKVAQELIDNMGLSETKRRTIGDANVAEGFWKKGRRYFRLFTRETDSTVDIALFSVRNLYVNAVALEAEMLQRHLTNSLVVKTSWIEKIWNEIFPEAYAQTVCPPVLAALCGGGTLDNLTPNERQDFLNNFEEFNGNSRDMTAGLANLNNALNVHNTNSAQQNVLIGQATDVYQASVQQTLAAINQSTQAATQGAQETARIAAQGAVDAATIAGQSVKDAAQIAADGARDTAKIAADAADRNVDKMLARSERVELAKDSAAVVAAGILTAQAVNVVLGLTGKAIEKLVDAITKRKDRAFIANALKEARENYASTRNQINELESQIDDYIAMGAFLKSHHWDMEEALSSLEKKFVVSEANATLAKQTLDRKIAQDPDAFDRYLKAEPKTIKECEKTPGLVECAELLKIEELVKKSAAANINNQTAKEKAESLRKFLAGKTANKDAFCKNMHETLEAIPKAEQSLQYYRTAYLAGQFVDVHEAADYLTAQRKLSKYTGNDELVRKDEKKYIKSEAELKKAEAKVAKNFIDKCEDAADSLDSYRVWKRDRMKVLREINGLDTKDFYQASLTSYSDSRTDYNRLLCYFTMRVSFGAVETQMSQKDWVDKCSSNAKNGDIQESRMCTDLWQTYQASNQSADDLTAQQVVDNRRNDRANMPIILQVAPQTNTSVVAKSLEIHNEKLRKMSAEQRCFASNTGCDPKEKTRAASQKFWDAGIAAVCEDDQILAESNRSTASEKGTN